VPTNAKRVPKIKKRPHGSGAAQAQRNKLIEHKILQKALTNTLNEHIIKTVKDTTHNQLEVNKMKDYYSSAAAMFDGGWRSTDKEEWIAEYCSPACDDPADPEEWEEYEKYFKMFEENEQ
jgi:hypothetical protein